MVFVTFEGIDGSGKTTQAKRLAMTLRERGMDVIGAKEPDGGHIGMDVRKILVNQRSRALDAYEEAMLISAARYDHVRSVIRPALEEGKWVVCDRFIDSTFAFQTFENNVSQQFFDVVCDHVVGATVPDFTFVLDLDTKLAGQRRDARSSAGQLDTAEAHRDFDRIRRGLLEAARRNPKRCHVIDASSSEDFIASLILEILHNSGRLAKDT